jgi:hypothetical protein
MEMELYLYLVPRRTFRSDFEVTVWALHLRFGTLDVTRMTSEGAMVIHGVTQEWLT